MYSLIPFEPLAMNLQVESDIQWHADKVTLNFEITGDLHELDLPDFAAKKNRVVGLWEATCFELFIKDKHSSEYMELNFSPCGNWNAFCFDDYRSGLTEYTGIKSSDIGIICEPRLGESSYRCCIKIDSRGLPNNLKLPNQVLIGMASVMKTRECLSYWALKHVSQVPDFHQKESFVIAL